MEEKTTTPWLHARWVKRQWSAGGWWRNETKPPKKFFCSLETEKEKKGGGGESFLTQCLLCFLSFWKLRDFSADRVGDSLHSLVFWRTCSPELYRPNKGLIREERVRERERERPDKFTKQTHAHSRGGAECVCPGRFVQREELRTGRRRRKKGGACTHCSRAKAIRNPRQKMILYKATRACRWYGTTRNRKRIFHQ